MVLAAVYFASLALASAVRFAGMPTSLIKEVVVKRISLSHMSLEVGVG